jgi:cyclopentanol dehydrogenase
MDREIVQSSVNVQQDSHTSKTFPQPFVDCPMMGKLVVLFKEGVIMAGRVYDKVALITGGASGIGRAACELLAEEGAWVFVADRQIDQARITAESIEKKGGRATALNLDVTRPQDWENAVSHVLKITGKIDVLINNAGVLSMHPVQDTTIEEWDQILNVNLTGVFLGTRSVIPSMQKANRGVIINVSSIAGMVGIGGSAAYQASKGAVRQFTKACAVDLAPFNIRVNSIHPGLIETGMTHDIMADPNQVGALLGPTLLKRIGQPMEIARALLFLASEESSFMTGAEMVVDGGYTAN